ncbi:methyltransferase domain protein [Lysobacter antibioticus]|nr:methyltransferase domain protein [Lysobacter antibioticus]
MGCGTAEVLDHIKANITYFGFDLSQSYIDAAIRSYGSRGTFQCRDLTSLAPSELPPCNIAIAIGLLHHLDDEGAIGLLSNLHSRLAPGGRLITIDGAYYPDQSSIARYILSRDRGQNVREGEAYRALVPSSFSRVELIRRDDLLNIPYTHAVLECTK